MKKKTLLLVTLLLMAIGGWAQRVVVSGTVVNADSRAPIAGVSVAMGRVSVVTNDDGFFTLKSDTEGDELVVTHLGYESQHIRLSEQPEGRLMIRLRPAAIQLQEVLVIGGDARELVRKAIDRIPYNYSRVPELLHCFYREKVMKRQNYITVAEGVIDMYKTDYSRDADRDRVAIRKGRRLLSPKRNDTLSVKVMGGPTSALLLDVVKNTDFLLNEEELNLYELKMELPTMIGDRRQYVVSLTPCVDRAYALYYGRLYIDQETLAFTRVELDLDMRNRAKATFAMLIKKPRGLQFKPKEMSCVIDYRTGLDGVMRLSYVRTTMRFNCDWRRRLFATSFSAFCEMAVTDIGASGSSVQPIKGRDSFDQRDAFFDKVDFFRDPAFWEDYNIIEPTESLDKAIDRLLKRKR